MRLAICSDHPLTPGQEAIIKKLVKQGYRPHLVDVSDNPDDYDAVWLWSDNDHQQSAAFAKAKQLVDNGLPIVNSLASHQTSISHSQTNSCFFRGRLQPLAIWTMTAPVNDYFFPLLCKPKFTSYGRDLNVVDNYRQALAHRDLIGEDCLLQELAVLGHSWRVMVADDQAIAAWFSEQPLPRRDQIGDWSAADLTPELAALAEAMAAAVGGRLWLADIIADHRGQLRPLGLSSDPDFIAEEKVSLDACLSLVKTLA